MVVLIDGGTSFKSSSEMTLWLGCVGAWVYAVGGKEEMLGQGLKAQERCEMSTMGRKLRHPIGVQGKRDYLVDDEAASAVSNGPKARPIPCPLLPRYVYLCSPPLAIDKGGNVLPELDTPVLCGDGLS